MGDAWERRRAAIADYASLVLSQPAFLLSGCAVTFFVGVLRQVRDFPLWLQISFYAFGFLFACSVILAGSRLIRRVLTHRKLAAETGLAMRAPGAQTAIHIENMTDSNVRDNLTIFSSAPAAVPRQVVPEPVALTPEARQTLAAAIRKVLGDLNDLLDLATVPYVGFEDRQTHLTKLDERKVQVQRMWRELLPRIVFVNERAHECGYPDAKIISLLGMPHPAHTHFLGELAVRLGVLAETVQADDADGQSNSPAI